MKNYFFMMVGFFFTILSIFTGGAAIMAAANIVHNDGNGTRSAGSADASGQNMDGASSVGAVEEMQTSAGMESLISRNLNKKVMELEPMSTPFDQLTRNCGSGEKTGGMEYEYASIGARPVVTTLKEAVSIPSGNAQTFALQVENASMFSKDDVIIVCPTEADAANSITAASNKAKYRFDGVTYASLYPSEEDKIPQLMLKVCGEDDTYSNPIVYCVNGDKDATTNQFTKLPYALQKGTKLLRIGKAANEVAAQTGRTAELPKTDKQFHQIFMAQCEESTLLKLTDLDVDWDFSKAERRVMQDMRVTQEGTFLFSDMGKVTGHPKENRNPVWFTKGAWWQAGKDIEFGHMESGELKVDENDLVDVSHDLNSGEGTGSKKKVFLCGSDLLQALEKIDSKKFRLKGDVQAWNLEFTSWKTTFNELLVAHAEIFDLYGHADWGMIIDPEYLEKNTFIPMSRSALNLRDAGIRLTDAAVLREASSVVLYAPNAHARVRLAKA